MISSNLEVTLNLAVQQAQRHGHEYVSVEHVLYALLTNNEASQALIACGASIEEMKKDLEDYFDNYLQKNILKSGKAPQPTMGFQRILQRAAQQVLSAGKELIGGELVLIAIFSEENSFALYFLNKQNITRFDIINFISHGIVNEQTSYEPLRLENIQPNQEPAKQVDQPSVHQQAKNIKKPKEGELLEKFTVNLCAKAKEGKFDPLVGREAELQRLVHILCRRKKNNPLLIGDAGVGKTALIEGLAEKIIKKEVPRNLEQAEIFSLDMSTLVAGTKFRGDFEQRFKTILKELSEHPKAILFIDEIHTIMGAGAVSGGALDAANILKPSLANGTLMCIGSTTFKEYRQYFENDHAMARRFETVTVDEPSIKETIAILHGVKKYYESFHHIKYSHEAIKTAVELSSKYIRNRKLPDKAIDLIDEAGAFYTAENKKEERKNQRILTARDIKQTISHVTKIPSEVVSFSDKNQLKDLGENLRNVVFGQNNAIDALENSITLAKSGLNNENQPIGSFLFSGPTGVGKTELAKQLAHHLGIAFIRFDMSEYMEKHSVSRLIGAPPGYVGYDEGGLLTDKVHNSPHAVLLLDEIEKAHRDIQNILLQVMDYGTLTDANGRETDFRHAIIIMTTNVGAADLSRSFIGFDRPTDVGQKEKEAINSGFSPEFRNRLDAIITFNPLPQTVISQIVDKFIEEINQQLKNKKIKLVVSQKAKDWLSKQGYDPNYGARPLRRLIQDKIKKPLSKELLFNQNIQGSIVYADLLKDVIVLETKKVKMETEENFEVEETV